MLLLDVIAMIGVAGVIGLGVAAIRKLRRNAKPEIQGAENAVELEAASLRRCHFCKKDTNFISDVYTNNKWYHRKCYMNEIEKK